MRCPRCQHDNLSEARFCERCASPLARTCSNCGTPLREAAKFCPACAHPVTSAATESPRFGAPDTYTPKHLAEKILTSKAALEGERKLVTVLFADLKGSMELLADRDPEDARRLLEPVIEHMIEAVHRYEGTVNQVMGDGIMALFGAPLAHEDHAVRACFAALRMQESIRQYAQSMFSTHGVTVEIRVGLNSGEVVVGTIGSDLRLEYTAVGQTTHLAARMEQLASPGATLLTASTLSLAEGYVAVKPRGPVPVKGLHEPVQVFELTGAGVARTRMQAAALRGLTRFVGRQREVDTLAQALQRVSEAHGQIAAMVGEPGIGKSRLVWEFTHSHRTHGWAVLESGSVSYGKATAYRPVIDLLKAYFQIEDRDDTRRIREKVTGKVLTLDRALEPAIPALLFLLDVSLDDLDWARLDPAQRRSRILDACKRLLLRESQMQPLAVVFEDLHWIDSETQAFLDGLVESLPTARILLLVNYRPEYQHRWGAKSYYTQIRIDPLGQESAEELLATLLGREAALSSLRQTLILRTDRNPFFLEESVRTLVETGVLAGTRGAYRLTKPIDALDVPATVQAMLAARIDRLDTQDKHLLQAAAVIGKDVPDALLRAIADSPEDRLQSELTNLQTAEFLYEAALFPDLEYTFKHALTQEVAYGSMLQERRKTLHARILETMERLYPDRLFEHVERLAQHAFRGEVWEKSIAFSRQAGEKALARSANREAVTMYEQALAALGHLPQTPENIKRAIDLRLFLQPPLSQLGEVDRLLDNSRKAEFLVEKIDDPLRQGRVLAFMCEALRFAGNQQEAIRYGNQAVALAERVGRTQLTVLSKLMLGVAYVWSGDLSMALDLLRASAKAASRYIAPDDSERDGHLAPLSRIYARYGYVWAESYAVYCLGELGVFEEATERGEQALRIAEQLNMSYMLAGACCYRGMAYLRQGDVDLATSMLERALHIWKTAEIPFFYDAIAAGLGCAYNLAGRAAEAISLLERGTDRTAPDLGWLPLTSTYLAQAYGLAGRIEEALATGERAITLARQAQTRGHQAWAHHVLGGVHASRRPAASDEAREQFRQSLDLARELGMRPLEAQCHLALGELCRAIGDSDQAREQLTTAARMCREMGMQFLLEKAELALKTV